MTKGSIIGFTVLAIAFGLVWLSGSQSDFVEIKDSEVVFTKPNDSDGILIYDTNGTAYEIIFKDDKFICDPNTPIEYTKPEPNEPEQAVNLEFGDENLWIQGQKDLQEEKPIS